MELVSILAQFLVNSEKEAKEAARDRNKAEGRLDISEKEKELFK